MCIYASNVICETFSWLKKCSEQIPYFLIRKQYNLKKNNKQTKTIKNIKKNEKKKPTKH